MTYVLITGATSGIGRHAALHLARRGHHILATGRRQEALDSLKKEAEGLKLDAFRLDITDPASIAQAVARVDELTNGHGLDVLVNNAGYGEGGAVLDRTDAEIFAQYDTNVFGTIRVTRAFVNPMIARGKGRIITVTSIGGRLTFPLLGVYNSTKYALESLCDAMRVELGPLGVDVVLLEPGAIDTAFMGIALDDTPREGPWKLVYGDKESRHAEFAKVNATTKVTSKALQRAVEDKRPKPRYMTPLLNYYLLFMSRYLPTRWFDGIWARFMQMELVQAVPVPNAVPVEKVERELEPV